MIIVDASLAVKWFCEEADSEIAELFYIRNAGSLIAPDLFAIEVAAALVRNGNIDKGTRHLMERALQTFSAMLAAGSVELIATNATRIQLASKLALDLGHPLKDCIYLALAMDLQCDFLTCDVKFAQKAAHYNPRIVTLSDFTP